MKFYMLPNDVVMKMMCKTAALLTAKLWVSNIFFDCAEKKLPLKVAD